ncbi:MAG: recombination regulator RecX [Clostridia bacterium]|nr:recombination regulator RecX [Clostridia bacterium]
MPTILSIRKQHGAVRIELEDEPALRIPPPLFRARPLRTGDELDVEAHIAWMHERGYRFALDTAVAYLAARPRTAREVNTRLEQAGYDETARERVVARLTQEGYLNDAEFAERWAQSRSTKALGTRRIAIELQKKGVDRDTIASALSQVDEEEQLRAATAHAQKLLARTHGKDARDIRRKVQAALARRGYDWSIVRDAMEQADEK